MHFTLGTASKQAAVSKATISRALANGELSYVSKDDSGYRIDPAELDRWVSHRRSVKPLPTASAEQSATVLKPDATALLEEQIAGLRALLLEKDRRLDELRSDRDRWADQAAAQTRLVEDMRSKPAQEAHQGLLSRWWGKRASAA